MYKGRSGTGFSPGKRGMGSVFLVFVLLGMFSLPAQADPGFLWLEPAASMRRMGGNEAPSSSGQGGMHGGGAGKMSSSGEGQGGHGAGASGSHGAGMANGQGGHPASAGGPPHGAGAGRAPSGPPPAAGDETQKDDGKKKEEKRVAMSRPAHYTLRTGQPLGEVSSPSFLLQAHATILRPDGTKEVLVPKEENGLVTIRDAALVQGRYLINVSAEVVEDGIRYRLFSQDIMRNVGEKPETAFRLEDAEPDFLEPRFAILDKTQDDERNFARIKRKYTGDELPLKIQLCGKPVPDLDVTMTTAEGWRQTRKTDENGDVRFTLVKEKFHDKGAIKTPSVYFVTAEIKDFSDEGQTPEILRSAIAFNVYPTLLDWQTKAAGFYTVVIFSAAIALAAAIRRKRRRRNPCV